MNLPTPQRNSPTPLRWALGWLLAGLPGSVWGVRELLSAPQPRAVLGAIAVDLGRHWGLGLATAVLTEAAIRGNLPRWSRWLGFWLAAIGVGALTLPTDLGGLADRLQESYGLSSNFWLGLTLVTISSAVPVQSALMLSVLRSKQFPRGGPALWLLLVNIGTPLIFATNVLVSPGTNPGAHLFLSWATAILMGNALSAFLPNLGAQTLTQAVHQFFAKGRRVARVVGGLLVLWPIWAWCVPHSNSVTLATSRLPNALPEISLGTTLWNSTNARLEALGPFFESRTGLPPVSPTRATPVVTNPIVIFLSIDSLREDILGDRKYAKHLPNLNKMKRHGTYFSNARAPGSMTKYTMAAISSGKYFSQQYWTKRGQSHWPDNDESPHLATVLTDGGVSTHAFPSTKWLSSSSSILRGFQHNEVKGEHFARRYKDWITGKSLTAQITEVLQRVKDKPTFLWAHYLDSHDPFDAGGKERNKFRRYLNSLRTVDQNVGKLRHAVEELGLSERALFVVFSDHGEAFGEHGATFHGTTLYDELLRVPLLIYGPTVVTQQRQELVSLIDLGPTVLDWFALPTPSHFMGESLGPLTRGKKTKFQRPVAAETRLKRTMLFTDGTKVIEDLRAHTVEVYDLEKDRGELRNLSDDEGDPRLARIDEMRQFFAVHAFTKAGYELPYVK